MDARQIGSEMLASGLPAGEGLMGEWTIDGDSSRDTRPALTVYQDGQDPADTGWAYRYVDLDGVEESGPLDTIEDTRELIERVRADYDQAWADVEE